MVGISSEDHWPHDVSMLRDAADERLLRLFSRHFITLVLMIEDPQGSTSLQSNSAFLIQMDSKWVVVTAGHIFKNLQLAMARGYKVLSVEANDSFAAGPYRQTVPLNIGFDDFVWDYDPDNASGIDIAMAMLPEFTQRALRANSTLAKDIGRDFVRLSSMATNILFLLGVPDELTDRQGHRVTHTLLNIPLVSLVPDMVVQMLRGPARRHYARIDGKMMTLGGIEKIDGMSGGPMFAVWLSPDQSHFDYTIVGVQSGWDRRTQQVAAWPLDWFAQRLARTLT